MSTDCKVSIMLLGEMGVGKTSLVVQFLKGTFSVYQAGTSITRHQKEIRTMDKNISMELWDTGGAGRFKNAIKRNYNKVDGVILVYDVTDVTSFYKLSNWFEEFRSMNEKAIVLIVGNKSDNPDVTTDSSSMVENFAEKENMEYFQASAKSGENVKMIFEHLTLEILVAKKIVPRVKSTHSHNSTLPNQSRNSSSKKLVAQPAQLLTTVTANIHSTNLPQQSRPQKGNLSILPVQSVSLSKMPSQEKQSIKKVITSKEPIQTNSSKEPAKTISSKEPARTISSKDVLQTISSKDILQTISSKDILQTISSKDILQTISSKEPLQTTSPKDPAETISSKEPAQTISTKDPAQTISSKEPAKTIPSKKPAPTTISSKDTAPPKDSSKNTSQAMGAGKQSVRLDNSNEPLQPESVSTSDELEGSDETDFSNGHLSLEEDFDWCFPDIDYLNSKEPIALEKQENLPPVIPLPDDIIQLHIEKIRQKEILKNNTTACCGV